MTNAEARFNNSLRPRKPEGSLGRIAQDVHLDSHTAPELCTVGPRYSPFMVTVGPRYSPFMVKAGVKKEKASKISVSLQSRFCKDSHLLGVELS